MNTKTRRPPRKGLTRTTPNQEKKKGPIREWIEAIIFGVVATTLIHMFLFQPFVVPTPSMAATVPVGDYIIVSKLHYGPRTPHSLGIPIFRLYVPGIDLPSARLPGFSDYKRGDVIAFHWPPEEKPVDQKQVYLKRLVGLPGDRIEVRDKALYVNARPVPHFRGEQHYYLVHKKPALPLTQDEIRAAGAYEVYQTNTPLIYLANSTEASLEQIRKLKNVESVEPYEVNQNDGIFPVGSRFTIDDWGPLQVPKRGMTIPLNDGTWRIYGTSITRDEGHTVARVADGTYRIDGQPAATYTFKQDYFFAMGDNRDDSLDSRFWGFVPEDHMVGKAIGTFFSWDKEKRSLRWNRLFHALR